MHFPKNILNSKAEFNRCHIPRLVVEEEDQDTKLERMKLEKEHREELRKILNDNDLTWEEQKARTQELAAKKRSRDKDGMEEEMLNEGAPHKRARKLQYELMDKNWGAEDNEGERVEEDTGARITAPPVIVVTKPVIKHSTTRLTTSVITDYFAVTKPGVMSGTRDTSSIDELWSYDEVEGMRFINELCDDSEEEDYEEYLKTQDTRFCDSSEEENNITSTEESKVVTSLIEVNSMEEGMKMMSRGDDDEKDRSMAQREEMEATSTTKEES